MRYGIKFIEYKEGKFLKNNKHYSKKNGRRKNIIKK